MSYYNCKVHNKRCEYPGKCINERDLARVRTLPLDTVLFQYRNGYISQPCWEAYTHLWQTSAPRFEVRVCDCEYCRVTYGHLRNEVYS